MKVVLVGPNIMQPGTTGFHIHKAGCKDLGQPKYRSAEKEEREAATVEEIARDVYADHIAEAGSPEDISDYINDFTVFPCAKEMK